MYGFKEDFHLGYFVAIGETAIVFHYIKNSLIAWRYAFLVDVVPIIVVIILRIRVRNPERSKIHFTCKKINERR